MAPNGFVMGVRRPVTPLCRAPALDSRFRGNDDGWGGAGAGAQVAVGVPLWRDGRFAKRPYGGVGEYGNATGVWVKPRERAMLGAQWAACDSVASAGYRVLVAMMRRRT